MIDETIFRAAVQAVAPVCPGCDYAAMHSPLAVDGIAGGTWTPRVEPPKPAEDECQSCGCPFPENPCRYCGTKTRGTR